MAKKTQRDDFFQRLRAQGLRKRTAKLISEATDGRREPAKSVQQTLDNLKQLVSEAEDRLSGRSAKREAAAKKAANTRKANAPSRSKASSSSRSKASTSSRSTAAKTGARKRARTSK